MEKLYFALTGIVGSAGLLVHRTRVQVLVLCWTAVRALVHRGEYRAHDAGPNRREFGPASWARYSPRCTNARTAVQQSTKTCTRVLWTSRPAEPTIPVRAK